jgi:hypothetical protein
LPTILTVQQVLEPLVNRRRKTKPLQIRREIEFERDRVGHVLFLVGG